QDGLLLLTLVQAVGQGGRGRLVDDAQHVQAGDLAGLLGGLPLGVVEVGRHGDDCVGDRFTEVGLGVPFQLAEHPGADLLRGVVLSVDVDGPVGAHVALDRADGAVDVGDGLPLGYLTDEHLAVLGKRDDGGSGPAAFGVGDDGRLSTLQDRDDRVGGTEIDTDGTRHAFPPADSAGTGRAGMARSLRGADRARTAPDRRTLWPFVPACPAARWLSNLPESSALNFPYPVNHGRMSRI